MNNIKKFLGLLFVAIFAFAIVGCTNGNGNNKDLDTLNAQADKIYLGDLSEVTNDLKLPKYAYGDKEFTVKWESSDESLIEIKEYETSDADLYYLGYVTMASEAKSLTLTATVTYKKLSVKREYAVTVLADTYEGYESIALVKAVEGKTKDTSKVKFSGTVSFVTGSGFGVTDSSATIYCYGSNHGRSLGEKVEVRGIWTYYNNMVQLKESVVKVKGTDKEFNIADVAEEKTLSEVAAIATKDVDPDNCTRIFKVKFAAKENASGAYNTYKLVDPTDISKYVDVTKYNDTDTLTEVGKLIGDKYYEGIIILYCSRSGTNGLWDVLYVPGSAKEVTIELTPEQKMAAVKADLNDTFNGKTVKANLELPTSTESGATITWASDNEDIISASGVYTAPKAKTEVKLTATIVLGDLTETVEITVNAKAATETEAVEITNPQVGEVYKLGMDQKGVNKLLFITGEMSGFYGATTEDHTESVDVLLEAAEGGYYITTTVGGVKKYISAQLSGTYINFKYLDEPNVVWTYNEEYNTMVANVDGTELFLGGNGTYETFGAYAIAKLSTNYPAHFYVEKEKLPYSTSPEVGVDYKLGIEQVAAETVLYATGEMSGFYGATVQKQTGAANFQLETAEGGYYLVGIVNGSKKYVSIEYTEKGTDGKEHFNFKYLDAATTIWTFSDEYKTLIATLNGKEFFIGTRGTYTTIGVYETSEIASDYPARLHFIVEEEENPTPTDESKTIAEVLEIGAALADQEKSADSYRVSGTVTEVTTAYDANYKNVTFIITDGTNTLECFRAKGDEAANVVAGDKVVLYGQMQKYGEKIQLVYANIESRNAEEGGNTTPEIPDGGEATIAQILTIGATLADLETTTNSYKVTGKVTEIKTAYDATYKNVSFYITDGKDTLLCFRVKGDGAENIAVGDTVVLLGQIQKYYETIELVYANIESRTAGEGGSTTPSKPAETPELTGAIVLDFAGKFAEYGANWEMSYASHSLTNTDLGIDTEMSIEISRANKQKEGNTIDDRPVIATKGSTEYVTIEVKNGKISVVEFDLLQWTTKTFDAICIEYFDGTNWVKCSDTITTPAKIQSSTLADGVTQVRLAVTESSSKNIQVGLSAISIVLK